MAFSTMLSTVYVKPKKEDGFKLQAVDESERWEAAAPNATIEAGIH
jgi:hypothetical protein